MHRSVTKGIFKKTRIDIINNIIEKNINHTHSKKYEYIEKRGKSKKEVIINLLWKDSKKKIKKKEREEGIKNINEQYLCIEIEFLLRYLDEKKKKEMKYFFSTVEDIFNNGIRNLKYK